MNLVDLIPPTYRVAAVLALSAALVGAGGCLGWSVNGWRLGARVADVKAQAAEDRAKVVAGTLAQLKTATGERDALAARLAASDAEHSATLQRLTDENEAMRGAVAAGSRVVRVRGAVCPGGANVPQAPAGSGVDSAAGAALTPDAGRAVYDLRAGIIRAGEQLAACQAAVRAMTGQ